MRVIMVCFQLLFSTWLRVIEPKKASNSFQELLLRLVGRVHSFPFDSIISLPTTTSSPHLLLLYNPSISLPFSYFNTLPLVLSSPSSWKCCQKHLFPFVLPTSLPRKPSPWGYFGLHYPLACVKLLNAWRLNRAIRWDDLPHTL